MLKKLKLTVKLPLVTVSVAALVAITMGAVCFLIASNGVAQLTDNRLEAVARKAAESVHARMESIERELLLTAGNPNTVTAVESFRDAWKELRGNQTEKLQSAYITNNPNPTGQKDMLDDAGTGTTYDVIHAWFHPWFHKFQQDGGYYDVFLFDAEGNLVYSVFKELDFATNFGDSNPGQWAKTDLGTVFREAMKAGEAGKVAFTDFQPYAPSADAPAGFISTPVVNLGGEVIGVLALQMPIDELSNIMAAPDGLGETGELLMVGDDGLLRNDSRFSPDVNDVLTTAVGFDPVTDADSANDTTSFGASHKYRNAEMHFAATPFEFHGVTWQLVAVQENREAYAMIANLGWLIAAITGGAILFAAAAGYASSRTVTKPLTGLVGTMRRLADGNTEVEVDATDRADEIGDMAQTVLVFRENAIERIKLEQITASENSQKQERQDAIDRLIGEFREEMDQTLKQVDAQIDEVLELAEQMSALAQSSADQSRSSSRAAETASSNVQSVASASEEMTAAILEISEQVERTKGVVETTTGSAMTARDRISSLDESAKQIEAVITLIQDIAEQTNLLALNATIEAARAGDAGKGFAVVAAEVKNLANQTAQATQDIGQQISGIQGSTNEAVSAIAEIAQHVESVSEYTGSIAAAIAEQSSTTGEINRSVQEAASGTNLAAENMMHVDEAIAQTSDASTKVKSASMAMVEQTGVMRDRVTQFLQSVSAA
tara:strand:+ start:262 stop:2424 length:2163 start_codon:yes stop_codon:yes gene_type:complete